LQIHSCHFQLNAQFKNFQEAFAQNSPVSTYLVSKLQKHIHSFQIFPYCFSKSTTTQRRCWLQHWHCVSKHAEALQVTTSEGLAQGPYVAARMGFEPSGHKAPNLPLSHHHKLFTLLTFSWPCFPRSQHLGHSQLFGRSSFSIPSFDRSGYFRCRHDGWRIFQQMPHSISGDVSLPRLSPLPPAADEPEVEMASPFSQMTQTAAVGRIGWYSMQHHKTNKVSRQLSLFCILKISGWHDRVAFGQVFMCQSKDSWFKSRPGQKFGSRFLLHLRPLANSAMMSTLTVQCQWEEDWPHVLICQG